MCQVVLEDMKILKIYRIFYRERKIESTIELCGTTIPVRGEQERGRPIGNREVKEKEEKACFWKTKEENVPRRVAVYVELCWERKTC